MTVGYDISNMKEYSGEVKEDFYGRKVPAQAHGTINLEMLTSSSEMIVKKSLELYERIVDRNLSVRRIYLVANRVKLKSEPRQLKQLDIFTDYEKLAEENERDTRRAEAILEIKKRYGNNAILKGVNFEEGATGIMRHGQIGGHKA